MVLDIFLHSRKILLLGESPSLPKEIGENKETNSEGKDNSSVKQDLSEDFVCQSLKGVNSDVCRDIPEGRGDLCQGKDALPEKLLGDEYTADEGRSQGQHIADCTDGIPILQKGTDEEAKTQGGEGKDQGIDEIEQGFDICG